MLVDVLENQSRIFKDQLSGGALLVVAAVTRVLNCKHIAPVEKRHPERKVVTGVQVFRISVKVHN
jgi:hypothetical protein